MERFWLPFWLPFWPPFRAELGQEPFPTSFFRLLRPPRALQEPLQRLSEGLRVKDVIRDPFWARFGPFLGRPGASKIRFSYETSYKFCEFAYFSSSRLPSSILDPPGLPWGRLLAPQMAETSLEIRLGPPESRSRLFFSAPRGEKEGSQKGPKKRPQTELLNARPAGMREAPLSPKLT